MNTTLPQLIQQYYQTRFDELNPFLQFHYASRLWSWKQDQFSKTYLQKVKHQLHNSIAAPDTMLFFQNPVKPNLTAQRARVLDTYPQIRILQNQLFRAFFFAKFFEDESYQTTIHTQLPEFQKTSQLILNNSAVLLQLSTFAINFLFLLYVCCEMAPIPFDRAKLLRMAQSYYNVHDPAQIQLFIYFFTHMVIGDTCFYMKPITDQQRTIYVPFFEQLDAIIKTNFDTIHLDNKLEFLVIAQLLNLDSHHQSQIIQEAETSKSELGDFLIDRHNKFPQSNRIQFDTSEHRNVLYLMANSSIEYRDSYYVTDSF